MVESKIRIAIIGMGKMGKLRYNIIKKHGGFQIIALCDPNRQNMNGFGEKKYVSWKECIDNEKLDGVVVCTINSVIPDIVCYSLERQLYVFSEKPPGRNLEDAIKMQKADINSKASLKFGFNHRYHNSVMEAKALIESGILGDVVCIRGVYGKAGNRNFANEWRNNFDLSGGGILLDQGIHMLDLICYFIGRVTLVKSIVNNLVWKEIPTEDSALAILRTNDGKIASLHSCAVQWKHKFDMDIICSNGYIALNGILTPSQSYGEETITYYKKDLCEKTGKLGRPMEHTLCFDSDESWEYEIGEFYDVIKKGEPVRQGTSEQAVNVMKLVMDIYADNSLRGDKNE